MASFELDWREPFPSVCRQSAVTIGNFDGVHRGHLALLQEAHKQSQALSGASLALTFHPHPIEVLRPSHSVQHLTTLSRRLHLLQSQVDHVVVLKTTPDLLGLSAEEFFQEVILERLEARCLVEGENFRFGKGRSGNLETLSTLCQQSGRRFIVVPSVLYQKEAISSSRIRQALIQGKVELVAEWLGRNYQCCGTVGVGKKRGRTLGFPTANLNNVSTLLPGDGVYAVRASVGDEQWLGAANLGPNPTFDEQARKVEVHLLDFEGDLYHFSVFNRWGEVVFQTTDPNEPWIGQNNQGLGTHFVPDGVYGWRVEAKGFHELSPTILRGTVTVVR